MVEKRLFADKLDTAYIQRVLFGSRVIFGRLLETACGETVNTNLFWFQPLSSSRAKLP